MTAGSKGLVIHGVIGAETVDSSGEQLIVKGCDISSMEKDGVLNWEHLGEEHGPASVIGKCIKCKKIYGPEDCDNAGERAFWDAVKVPLIYAQFRLFDAQDHAQAKAAAGIIRDQQASGEPQTLRFSLEGSTLHMGDDKRIMESICRRCALTTKPCNKVAMSEILHDPLAAEESSELSLLGVSKFEHPSYQHVVDGGVPSIVVEVDDTTENFIASARKVIDLAKAMEGGSYNAAPSTLTGGAALQREDFGEEHRRRLVTICKSALRDHDKSTHGPFREYLKKKLDDEGFHGVSDEFLDRFDSLSDELGVKAKLDLLRKAQEAQAAEYKPPENARGTGRAGVAKTPRVEREAAYHETLARIKEARATSFPDEDEGGVIPPAETAAFKRVRPRKDVKYGQVTVDVPRGVLYIGGTTPGADVKRPIPSKAYKLHAPTDSAYMDLLTKDENNVHHDRAMDNWVTVHRLLRQGKLPSKLVAHTSLYTLMAPSEGGPIQDLSYALFQDLIAKGFDPTKQYDPDELSEWEKEFGDMAVGQYMPEYMRDHFLQDSSNIWRGPNIAEKVSGTVRSGLYTSQALKDFGENPRLRSMVGKLSLGDKQQPGKWNTVARYAATHHFLNDLVQKHGTDADAAMEGFLNQKKADPSFGYGFGIKTARYTGGMLGMGKHVVPDTHFIRHLFGLHPDDPRIGDVKGIFAGDSLVREQALRGVDEWFRRNHPAFAWTRQKLQKRYGEDFGDHATFPAFWLHWTLIAPHERTRKWPAGQAENEGTDHEVFWNSARHILDEFGLPSDPHDPRLRKKEAWAHGGSLPARTVHAQKAMEDRYGPVAASLFFYRFLAPVLVAADKPAALYKAELLARLAKGEFAEESAAPKSYMHKGSAVEPGEIQVGEERMPLVAIGKDYHHVLSPFSNRLMKLKAGHPNTRIVKEPRILRTNTMVDSKKHGHPTLHGTDLQHDIIHGLDMAKRIGQPKKGVTWKERGNGDAGWYQSGEGHLVFVKPNVGIEDFVDTDETQAHKFGAAHREAAFHRLADSVFGLGEHVPATTVFKHPVTGDWHSAQQKVEGDHYSRTSMYHKESLGQMARTGILDKLTLMDMVLGHFDRHTENGLISPDGRKLHLIDNGAAFPPSTPGHPEAFVPNVSEYWKVANKYNDGPQWYNKPLHPAAVQWVESLNTQKMAEQMDRLGVPKSERDEAVRRLQALQARAAKGNLSRGAAYYAPFIQPSKVRYGSPQGQQTSVEERSGLRDPVEG